MLAKVDFWGGGGRLRSDSMLCFLGCIAPVWQMVDGLVVEPPECLYLTE